MTADHDADAARVFETLMGAQPAPQPASDGRPAVVANMVQTVDGRISQDGRSATLGGPADTGVLMLLRAWSDAVLVGSGTLTAEGYGRPLPDSAARERRESDGRTPEPLICVVSRRLELSPTIALFQDPAARVVILTASDRDLPPVPAAVEYLRAGDGGFDLEDMLRRLRAEHQVELVVSEGGPTLNAQLLDAGLLDELWLALHPALAGPSGEGRLFGGDGPADRHELALRAVATAGDFAWIRYGRA